MKIKLSQLRKLIRETVADEMRLSLSEAGGGIEEADSDKKDKDGDGDEDFADVMMARMMASGMSKDDAVKKTRKHDK